MDHDEWLSLRDAERAARKPTQIRVCTSSGCRASGSQQLLTDIDAIVKARNLEDQVEVLGVGCPGLCSRGPLVEVYPHQRMFCEVSGDHIPSIVEASHGKASAKSNTQEIDLNHPFFAKQCRLVRATAGTLDPLRIESYIAADGYEGLYQALQMSPAAVVESIVNSGLRGRGGAGYPTGLKWATVAKMPAGQKYVVCNGDEGDPGAFMDRSVMEDSSHQVIEGMAIAGYAVGANRGFIYVRAEYPLAIERLDRAIKQANKTGLLGNGIFETAFDFQVEIRIGAGAFVCGEETALMASIEGQRGTPRPRPPYPAESGLWGCPTLINNVETMATIPTILRKGSQWFASLGTSGSKGTKIFSLTGKVVNAGLVEVEMGTKLREIVEGMGGGVPDGKPVKAVQTGGPSGGCIPASLLDTPIDYESLAAIGSIMGSGGMIVMDDGDRMPEVARFFMEFCADESCGKCVPCRVGTVQLQRLLTKFIDKQATPADLERLVELSHLVKETSLCGLGQSAPNPVLSTLQYFGDEYQALLQETPPVREPQTTRP